jgi:ribosomal protein L7/L12
MTMLGSHEAEILALKEEIRKLKKRVGDAEAANVQLAAELQNHLGPRPGMSHLVKRVALGLENPFNSTSSKISAIRILREECGLGLVEAKERIETWLFTLEAAEMRNAGKKQP